MPTPSNRPGRVARLKAGLCGECGLHPRFRGQTRCEPCIKQMKARYQEKREIKKHELDRLASQGGLPDGEEWRPISDFPGYRISRSGRVQSCRRSTKSGMALKHYQLGQWYDLTPRATRDGHLRVVLYRDSRPRSRYVHTLLAESFIGPKPDGMICRHINDIPDDNRVENLAWGTHQENIDDMFLNGRKERAIPKATKLKDTSNYGQLKGEKNHAAKIRAADVLRIRRLYKEGCCRAGLAREYGISTQTVWRIGTEKNWRHLPAAS